MLRHLLATSAARFPALAGAIRRPRLGRPDPRALARRFAHFWIVWSLLLLVHEAGHAYMGARQGLTVRRVTVGAGPVLWRGERGETEVVLRLLPLVGVTSVTDEHAPPAVEPSTEGGTAAFGWDEWGREVATLGGGVAATLALAILAAGVVAMRERRSRARWVWGRILVADALVLTVFNFLPVPPLDGGRAVVGAIAAWRGAPLPQDALFWVHLGGLALAIVPMMLWTRWTSRIDAFAMRWRAPER